MQGKCCAVISGGSFSPLTGIENCDFVIACDKGLEYAQRCGIRPDLLIGDFDSYQGILPNDLPRLDLPVEKDDTDTGVAFLYAAENEFESVELYCALGGRLDHLLGNIQTAASAVKKGLSVHIIAEDTEMYLFSGKEVVLPEKKGWSLSVISLTDRCTDVCISGTKYILNNYTMTNTGSLGISNEWRGTAKISVKEGILMVVMSDMNV